MAQTDGPAHVDEVRSYRPEVLTYDRASQSSLSTILFAGLILALVTGAIYMLVSYLRSSPTETAVVTNSNVSNSNQTAVSPDTSETPAAAGDLPTMQNVKVEFRSTEPISLRATSDGKTSENIVTPGSSQTFEPKQSLKLSYAKSLAQAAQLFINGKQIALPMQPENPKRIPIEIEINAANLGQIWQTGQYAFASQVPAAPSPAPAAAATAPASTPRPAANNAARANANTASNRPTAARTPIVVTNAPRATPRPNED